MARKSKRSVEGLEITTDGRWKPFKYDSEVPKSVLKSRFDYLNPDEVSDGFFKYKNTWHHTSEFMGSRDIPGWDGVLNFSFSDGLLLKISRDGEQYQVAHYRSVSS